MHIFCKTHHVFDFDHSTIIQHCFTIHASKYLMLIRFYNQCICPRRTVKNRFKIISNLPSLDVNFHGFI